MNDTPTPESNKAKIAFTSLFANDDAYWVPFTVSRKLERERDRLAEALRDIDEMISWGHMRKDSMALKCVLIAREALAAVKGGSDE